MQKTLTVFAVAAGLAGSPAHAISDADAGFYDELIDAIQSSQNANTVRQAYSTCLDISKRLTARTDVGDFWGLYFEANLSRCFAFAKHNGRFSDNTGDACSHAYNVARKITEIAAKTAKNPEFIDRAVAYPDLFFKDEFDYAVRVGSDLKCLRDIEALRPK